MAVICTFLASSGFVAAGYADTSSADAAAALSPQNFSRISSSYDAAAAISFAPVAVAGVGEKISFDKMFLQARKPAAQQILDLTDPNGNTPHLARGFTTMRGNIPEVSVDEISQVRAEILTAAYQGLGHPYVWGGTSFYNGWDCSGFVQWAYAQAGVALPRTEQWAPMIETNSPQPGDIVVQNPDGPNHWSHIGIYIGNGKMISALNPSVGTIMHAPSDTSSSSTYFTIPAFASADEQAKADAAAKKADKGKSSASATATPTKSVAATPTPTKSVTPTAPATPAPTKPTEPGTTKPATPKPPVTTPSTTLPPTTVPTTPPTPKPTVATQPATTAPATTAPETKAPDPATPATTTEAAKTSAASETPTPSSTPPPSSSPILRPSDVSTAAESQAADPTAAQTAAARSTGTEPTTAPSP